MSIFNYKAFENVIVSEYGDMQDKFMECIGELNACQWETCGGHKIDSWVTFSMFDTFDDEDEWMVKHPDFSKNEVIYNGCIKVEINDWENAWIYMDYPKANDIYRFFANNHDGHHGFLESIRFDEKNKKIILSGGS